MVWKIRNHVHKGSGVAWPIIGTAEMTNMTVLLSLELGRSQHPDFKEGSEWKPARAQGRGDRLLRCGVGSGGNRVSQVAETLLTHCLRLLLLRRGMELQPRPTRAAHKFRSLRINCGKKDASLWTQICLGSYSTHSPTSTMHGAWEKSTNWNPHTIEVTLKIQAKSWAFHTIYSPPLPWKIHNQKDLEV